MSARELPDDIARLRVPPHSLEAEQSVLGGILVDNRGWDRLGDLLNVDSFYDHRHRLIYSAIASLVNACKPADAITVHAALAREPRGDAISLDYMAALATSVPSASNIRRYAEIVAERATERSMLAAADEIAGIAYSGDGTAEEKLDRAVTLMLQLESRRARVSSIRPLGELVVERIDRVNELHEQGDSAAAAWSTPFPALNRLLPGHGMGPGHVYVIGARPSVGKTALAQAVLGCFGKAGLPGLFLSQEMPSGELTDRFIAEHGCVDLGHMQSARLSDAEWSGVSRGAEIAAHLPIFVDDTPALTIGAIRAKARSVRGLRVLVVDYLQLTASTPAPRGQSNRNAEIEEVSHGLKSLAKELGIAVILLSQLNRDVEKRPGKRPGLADLRDSGSIEQDADVVMLLWPLQELPVEGCSMVGVDVAKNRGGPRAEFALCFWANTMRIGEAAFPISHYTAPRAQTGDL